MRSYMYGALMLSAMIPSEDDWDSKIEELFKEFDKTKFLPRKKKKLVRKKLNKDYSFYQSMKRWSKNPFGHD